ncbi:MAG TPA: hypothetical protein VHP63_02985, partial [candidate division Zixibacteria bacterium]|nr:hypothetical protein [candidate division Zixibacteria bacterium]
NSYLELSLRGSDFNDDINPTNDRKSIQYRVTGSAPVPRAKGLFVNGGFQHYDLELPNIADTLTANTGWGGLRYFHEKGYYAKYSFIWDRARTTTDLAATDNITNALYLGKEWRSLGGFTVGYSYKLNDDINDELQTDAVHLSGWYKPHRQVTLRAGYGTEISDVESGTTLTGDKDVTRYNVSGTYKFKQGTWRAKFESKQTENKDIGSNADFTRIGTDINFNIEIYGDFSVSYDFLNGDYENSEGTFEFNDHVLWGNFLSRRYREFQFGFGCTYVRSLEDLDVENFSLKFSGNYIFSKVNKVEIIYTVHNFDDFDDPSPVYSRYYTANIVEISLSRGF